MSKKTKLFYLSLLFALLVLMRYVSSKLFYDPFQRYFDHDYLLNPIPEFDSWKLFINMFLRYAVNSIISLGIIWIAFRDKNFIQFSIKFFILAFLILIFAYFVILNGELKDGYLFAFYVRRFLIHPLLLLVLFPAFYYKNGGLN